MTKPQESETVYAKDATDKYVWRAPEGDDHPIRVKIKTVSVRGTGRGFVKIGYSHPTVGSMSEVVPAMTRLELAP